MNTKWVKYVVIVVLAVVAFLLRRYLKDDGPEKPKTTNDRKGKDPASDVNRNRGFDRRISYIEYTEHARCRMECRHISNSDVEGIMQQGTINYNKSDVNARPCPAYAIEGLTDDNHSVRIVFGQCDLKTKVITCIDLETDWECHCPGDDNKYKNKD